MLAQRSSSALALSASRQAARRSLSSQPKMHKVKDHWQNLKSKRPIDQDDLHVRTDVYSMELSNIPDSFSQVFIAMLPVNLPPSL
jgi:hypothetical protein